MGDSISAPLVRGSANYMSNSSMSKSYVDNGATVEGGRSSQSFTYGDIDVHSNPSTTLQLKIVGVKDRPSQTKSRRFCTICGNIRRKGDRFCGKCGNKF